MVSPGGAESAGFVQGNKVNTQTRAALLLVDNTANGRSAGLGRAEALPHEFDYQKRSTIAHDIFAQASGACRADVVIDVQPAADDWRIANASRQFAP